MKTKAVQYFTKEYLDYCKKLSPEEIVEFIENFQKLYHGSTTKKKSRLISIKIPEHLLEAFRFKAESQKIPYQTQIKKLMEQWVLELEEVAKPLDLPHSVDSP